MIKNIFFPFLVLLPFTLLAQNIDEQKNYQDLSWKEVALRMPTEWYATEEALQVSENLLIAQKAIGGWAKNEDYHHTLSESEKAEYLKEKSEVGATFDNGATIMELRFLGKVYNHHKVPRYREAFQKGLNYIFEAQYDNGGWPQFYPSRDEDEIHYSDHITFNDNVMVNIMKFLDDVSSGEFASLQLGQEEQKARKAFEKGIDVILNTQIKVAGEPTVWCAQHDLKSLEPTDARKYELKSFSGAESVNITLLLMDVKNPSQAIVAAVDGAVKWFESHKINNLKIERTVNGEGLKDKVVVVDKNAGPLWARFYDLETGKPFFCGRDGIKKNTLSEIDFERRNGYSWYTNDPEKVLKKYPEWKREVAGY